MYIKIKVTAGARKEKLIQISEDHFEISVREKAERNRANARVREMIAEFFSVPIGKTKIISGAHSPGKIFNVDIKE
jgi:uncharacterized protein YggU (UPF0235/DUF167 family)